jgi:hypothetical protein
MVECVWALARRPASDRKERIVDPGARVSILFGGDRFGTRPTHEITGRDGEYVLICPIEKLDSIRPGQTSVPVSRIHPHRLKEFVSVSCPGCGRSIYVTEEPNAANALHMEQWCVDCGGSNRTATPPYVK